MADHQVGDSLPLLSGQTQSDFVNLRKYQAKATQEQALYPNRKAYLSARARKLGYSSYDAWLKERRRENVPRKNTARAKTNRERTVQPDKFANKAKLYTFRFDNHNYALRVRQIEELIRGLDPRTVVIFKVVGNTYLARKLNLKMKDWDLKGEGGVPPTRPADVHTLTTELMDDYETVVDYLRRRFEIQNYTHGNGRFINYGIKSVQVYTFTP